MKISFIQQTDNAGRLILIFAGWSTGPEMYRGVGMPGWDVAVVHDYSDGTLDTTFLNRYCTVYLFAWSLGVAEADRILPTDRITAAFAINGTITPVSDRFGIPPAIYHGTAENLNPRNLTKFRRRMMPDGESFKNQFQELPDETECSRLAEQLRSIASRHSEESAPRIQWTRAYVGSNDRIFPPLNTAAAWRTDPEVKIIESDDAHYIDIQSIVSNVIADTMKVSRKFSKASATYDSAAVPQQMIAMHLARLMEETLLQPVNDLLEIGPGTGFLTSAYSRFLTPDRCDFVDITETGPFNITGECRHHCCDAEEWIRGCKSSYDLIASSSAIQWFADIPGFLRECARVLRPGGMLALATFLPGNLGELDALRPSPLLYPTEESLRNALGSSFKIIALERNKIRMIFESRRQLLMHLKHTGVAGSAGSSAPLKPGSEHTLTSLTYLPVYLIALK